MKQEPPFAVQIELTEGCSLRCHFCGINGITEKRGQYRFLDPDVAKDIARKIRMAIDFDGWNPRIEFAMHGEPTENASYIEIVRIFRAYLPFTQLMITTNGTGFLKQPFPRDPEANIKALFKAGINIIALDAYESVNIAARIRAVMDLQKMPYADYPKNPDANPHQRIGVNDEMFVFVQDISVATKGTHSQLNNHCGTAAPLDFTVNQRCAKPFREMSIRWDGKVALCCNDWRGVYLIGDVGEWEMDNLWNHERFTAARYKLYHAMRDFGPCFGCNAKSTRVGLLPDKKGQQELPKPGPLTEKIIKKAMEHQPLTQIVKRSWE